MSYTDQQIAEIGKLFETIEGSTVPMAVVDYLGRRRMDLLGIIEVTKDDPERFGVRDLRHVRLYDLTVVRTNPQGVTP